LPSNRFRRPSGQFGTRLQGGKDAASPRYIFTRLAPIARALFHPDDDALLDYLDDDGLSIEPQWYAPVIPLVLVNGADGIGTGYSTSIPCYNPVSVVLALSTLWLRNVAVCLHSPASIMQRDIIEAVRARITGSACAPLKPWYRGFKGTCMLLEPSPLRLRTRVVGLFSTGTIEPKDAAFKSFTISGVASVDEAGESLLISELPIRRWTQDCKALLVSFVTGEAAKSDEAKGAAKTKAKAGSAKAKAPPAAGAAKPKGTKAMKATAASAVEAAPAKRAAKKAAPRKAADSDADEDDDDDDDGDDDDFDLAAGAADESSDDDEELGAAKSKKARAAGDAFVVPPGEPILTTFSENHTDTTVSFTCSPTPLLAPLLAKNAGKSGPELSPALTKLFKLQTTISTGNMHLFDANGCIKVQLTRLHLL
jgi:hypothetical protein